jgi:hypothetical protein
MITLRLTHDDLTPALGLMAAAAKRPRAIFAAAGRAVTNLFRRHLRELDATRPNKLGGERQHFWLALSRSVNLGSLSDTGATVVISDPRAAQKHFGGTITAKRAKNLAIPVNAAAYGRSPAVLEQELGIKLFAWKGKLMGQLGGKEQGVTVYYILKPSVTQGPDPEGGILPEESEIKTVAIEAGQAALERQMGK